MLEATCVRRDSKHAAGATGRRPFFLFARPAPGDCAEAACARRDSKHAAGAAGRRPFCWFARPSPGNCAESTCVRRGGKHAAGAAGRRVTGAHRRAPICIDCQKRMAFLRACMVPARDPTCDKPHPDHQDPLPTHPVRLALPQPPTPCPTPPPSPAFNVEAPAVWPGDLCRCVFNFELRGRGASQS